MAARIGAISFTILSESCKGSAYAHFDACGTDFAIAGGGLHGVRRHIETKIHRDNVSGMVNQPTILSPMPQTSLEERIS